MLVWRLTLYLKKGGIAFLFAKPLKIKIFLRKQGVSFDATQKLQGCTKMKDDQKNWSKEEIARRATLFVELNDNKKREEQANG